MRRHAQIVCLMAYVAAVADKVGRESTYTSKIKSYESPWCALSHLSSPKAYCPNCAKAQSNMTKPQHNVGHHAEAVSLLTRIFSVLQLSELVTDIRRDFTYGEGKSMLNESRYIREIHTESADSNYHEHITALRWNTLSNSTLNFITKVDLIAWLNEGSEHQAFVSVGTSLAVVKVINPAPPRSPFVQTIKDGTKSDNLLWLPRF